MNVAVIITTYNRPDFLRRTLNGYLNQTRPPEEIVIADDGSTPETAQLVAKSKEAAGTNIIHVWQEDLGFRAARIRNMAVARSTCEYLILADDDSIPTPHLVWDHLKYAERNHFLQGHRVLLGPVISPFFTQKDISVWKLISYGISGKAQNIKNALRLPWPLIRKSRKLSGIRSCNMSFYREDFLAVNGFNQDFTGWGKEDSELAVRFYKYGLKRKDIRFRAACFHLYHPEFSRDKLHINMKLLEEVQKQENYFCKNGIDQFLRAD